eukprot:m51a1_g10055 hypothetical protein (586) ;mRNA; f:60691-64077
MNRSLWEAQRPQARQHKQRPRGHDDAEEQSDEIPDTKRRWAEEVAEAEAERRRRPRLEQAVDDAGVAHLFELVQQQQQQQVDLAEYARAQRDFYARVDQFAVEGLPTASTSRRSPAPSARSVAAALRSAAGPADLAQALRSVLDVRCRGAVSSSALGSALAGSLPRLAQLGPVPDSLTVEYFEAVVQLAASNSTAQEAMGGAVARFASGVLLSSGARDGGVVAVAAAEALDALALRSRRNQSAIRAHLPLTALASLALASLGIPPDYHLQEVLCELAHLLAPPEERAFVFRAPELARAFAAMRGDADEGDICAFVAAVDGCPAASGAVAPLAVSSARVAGAPVRPAGGVAFVTRSAVCLRHGEPGQTQLEEVPLDGLSVAAVGQASLELRGGGAGAAGCVLLTFASEALSSGAAELIGRRIAQSRAETVVPPQPDAQADPSPSPLPAQRCPARKASISSPICVRKASGGGPAAAAQGKGDNCPQAVTPGSGAIAALGLYEEEERNPAHQNANAAAGPLAVFDLIEEPPAPRTDDRETTSPVAPSASCVATAVRLRSALSTAAKALEELDRELVALIAASRYAWEE